jgi:hypothetical protein
VTDKEPPIEKLERIFQGEKMWEIDAKGKLTVFDNQKVIILPNGEIRAVGDVQEGELKPGQKPLTFRENLGGEYGAMP